ncbi:hypothetical protein [Nocardioides sp. LHG3406-4]|uniref:hypothetical protein n=1 Tax=Nocardioides sp. LHG3406-4 TaxID=2804575 RepID=UPI003CE98E33
MNPVRRSVAALVALGLAAAVPSFVGAAPATADPGCLSEAHPVILLVPTDGCDDDTPPDTTLAPATAPNAAGWVSASSMSFTFAQAAVGADAGPWTFECKLAGPAQAHDWRACTSPASYSNLIDSGAGGYTFSVRAIDDPDRLLNPGALLPLPDVPDLDATPAQVVWGQDTKAPRAFVTPEAYDEETPDFPVVGGRSVLVRLNASEKGASFTCTDGGETIACNAGAHTFTDLASGAHSIVARAVDAAGNTSAESEPFRFTVPTDLEASRGWKRRAAKGYLDGDLVTTRKRGARLVLPGQKTIKEIRVYAATGPRMGAIRVRVGHGAWRTVKLAGPAAVRKELVVISRFEGTRKGKVTLETTTRKRVRLDAVVVR